MLLLLLLLSHFSRVQLLRPHRRQPTRLPRPWDSLGKNTGVGCHFLLQCMKVKSQSEVAQSCPTLHDPMDCSPPGSSVHGIFQARVLEWSAIAFSSYMYICMCIWSWIWQTNPLTQTLVEQSIKQLSQKKALLLLLWLRVCVLFWMNIYTLKNKLQGVEKLISILSKFSTYI